MEKVLKYVINDDEWSFIILSSKDYNKKASKDSDGLTNTEQFTVYFREKEFKLSLIKHELWHVHQYYCFFERADIKPDQHEEIGAELFAFRGDLMTRQALEIYEKLKS
jgi:hypothetical protein